MAHDREVAGLRCTEVLARLSDYLDGDLPAADTAQVQAHLRGCDWCERFGGRFRSAVGVLRQALGAEAGGDDEELKAAAQRLRERLDRGG